MKKLKRVLAMLGVVILVGMYVVTFILGVTASPATKGALMASLACTVIVPGLLYAFMLVAKILSGGLQADAEKLLKEQEKKKS